MRPGADSLFYYSSSQLLPIVHSISFLLFFKDFHIYVEEEGRCRWESVALMNFTGFYNTKQKKNKEHPYKKDQIKVVVFFI